MKQIRKFLASMLSVLIVISAMPFTAMAADEDIFAVNDYCEWSYTASSGTLYINADGALVAPDKGNHGTYKGGYLPLFKEDGSLFNVRKVTKLIFGKDITQIDDISLSENTKLSYGLQFYNLESIEFEEGSQLSSLPDYFCYDGIAALTTISLPESLISIGEYAFYDCPKLENVYFSDSLESLGKYSFYNCDTLQEIDLSKTKITKINDYAFWGCNGLTTLNLPEHELSVGAYSLRYCTALNNLTNSKYITTVYEYGMANCNSLAEPDFSGLVIAKDYAFYGDENLTSEMPSLEEAWSYSFYNTGFTHLDLSSTRLLGPYVFSHCKKLETVKLPEKCKYLESHTFAHSSLSKIENYDNLTTIGNGAFYGTNISSFDMPDTIQTIGEAVFTDCFNLEYIELPESLTSIGNNAFSSSGIKTVDVKCKNINLSTVTDWYSLGLGYNTKNLKAGQNVCVRDYTSNDVLKETCKKTLLNYISVTETDEGINEKVEYSSSGTFNNGVWTAFQYQHTYTKLLINAEGKIEKTSFTSTDGDIMNLQELNSKYNITGIEFEEGITGIGDGAFRKSTLTDLVIPDNVESIGRYSFADSYINTLSLGTGITEIPEGAFYNTGTSEIDIPENITTLGKKSFGAFDQTDSAQTRIIKIPATVTDIYYDLQVPSDNAVGFTANGDVDENVILYVVPDSAGYDYAVKTGAKYKLVLDIIDEKGYVWNETKQENGNYLIDFETMTWSYDTNSSTLTISGNGIFQGYALYYSDGTRVERDDFPVKKIVFEEGITSIQRDFEEFSISYLTFTSIIPMFNPTYIELPTTLQSIGSDVFCNCTNLKTINIPDNVTAIGSNVFDNCTSLESVSFGKGLEKIESNTFINNKSLRFVDFGGVKEIGDNAFKNCSSLEEIVLPDSVTTVGNDAFYGCVSVLSIDIGSSLKSVGTRAFANMPLCERVVTNSSVFNDGVVKGINVFNNTGCSTSGVTIVFDDVETADFLPYADMKITGIELGSNVCAIKNQQYLTSLKEISVNNDNTDYYSDNNYLYSSDNILALVPMTLETVKIPDGTTSIGDYACYGTNASGITLPDSITSIGKYAFAGSTSLKSISINEGTKTIGDNAFENCVSLKLLALPDFVESIGTRAFAGCTNIASIIFDYDLLTIGTEAFEGCTSLAGIVFPEQLDTIGDRAFMNCTGLEYAYIWYSQLGEDVFKNDDLLTIYTMVGSDAYRYAREYDTQYSAYTDEDAFYDEWAVKLDVLAGYLGYCSDGHGDIQYLTVYEADCENDGYIIGVCEYCSEILDEIHIDAYNHSYVLTADIPATETTKGMKVYTCENCGSSYAEYTPPASEDFEIETHTVKGSVVIATNNTATAGKTPLKNVSIVIDGYTMATTDADGKFSFKLDTGVYEAQLKYAYGFTRTIYIVVEDEDIDYDTPIPIIGCDFNKDGIIDNDDLTLFQYVVSSKANDPSYLEFVDMNNDGYINAKDRAYIISCKGLKASEMKYPEIIIQK